MNVIVRVAVSLIELLSLSPDGQDVVTKQDLNVVFVEARQFRLESEVFVGFENIDVGHPVAGGLVRRGVAEFVVNVPLERRKDAVVEVERRGWSVPTGLWGM